MVIQIAELNRNQDAYHNEQDFSDRVGKIVANLIGGDHFHSQFTKYGLHERRGIGITLGRQRWAEIGYKAEKGYRSITQRGWLSQQVEMIEIVGSKAYGTH